MIKVYRMLHLPLLRPLLLIGLSGCVSVNLSNNKIKRSTQVSYEEPQLPFVSFSPKHLDAAWKNKTNGNSISYLSDCQNESDPSIKSIHDGIVAKIEEAQIEQKTIINFNRRKAMRTTVKGSVDGVLSKMELLIFKKNSCIYVLTYVALDNTYPANINNFEHFLKEFKVQ